MRQVLYVGTIKHINSCCGQMLCSVSVQSASRAHMLGTLSCLLRTLPLNICIKYVGRIKDVNSRCGQMLCSLHVPSASRAHMYVFVHIQI